MPVVALTGGGRLRGGGTGAARPAGPPLPDAWP